MPRAAATAENGPPFSTRREEILQVAKTLFAEQGYAATSTRDLAEACGLLAGSLYSHFRSKAQMLELVIGPFFDQLIARQREVVATDASGVERLEAMIRAVVDLCASHKAEIRMLHYDWPHIAGNEELASILEQSTVTLDLWHDVISAGIDDGTLRASVRPETAMRVITERDPRRPRPPALRLASRSRPRLRRRQAGRRARRHPHLGVAHARLTGARPPEAQASRSRRLRRRAARAPPRRDPDPHRGRSAQGVRIQRFTARRCRTTQRPSWRTTSSK